MKNWFRMLLVCIGIMYVNCIGNDRYYHVLFVFIVIHYLVVMVKILDGNKSKL